MVAETKHIIEKVRVKLTTPSVSEAHELKNDFSSYFSDYVLPYIEDYLDELFQGKSRKVVRMNQLKLSLSLDDVLRSKDELTIQLKKLLDDQLKVEIEKENNFHHSEKHDQAKDLKILDSETHYFEAFCFFLERGNCPWWLSNEKLSFLLEEKNLQTFFSSHKNKINELFTEAHASKVVINRLTAQFSPRFLIWLIQQVNLGFKKLTIKEISFVEREVQYLSRKEQVLFFQNLFEVREEKKVSDTQFDQLIHLVSILMKRKSSLDQQSFQESRAAWVNVLSLISDNKTVGGVEEALDQAIKQAIDLVIEESSDEQGENKQLSDEGLYIDNAGIIVLHPFLKHFFTNIDLLKDDELKDKELAVQLLHYIATGNEEDWEHTMLFEKFLCDMSLDFPLSKKSLITKKHKKEVEELLDAVLENWKLLGNSSRELLQNEFLARPGKLFQDNVSPRLVVERKTQDILLDQLSWNISIIKLPWTKQIIYATW